MEKNSIQGLKANKRNVLSILLHKYGLLGTLNIAFRDVLYDYLNGVDTFSPVPREEIFDDSIVEQSNRYVPSTFDLIKSSINLIQDSLDLSESKFVDYGSGKGKVLIGGSKFPFKKLIGIEYSDKLHNIASNNIRKLGLENRVVLYNSDATQFCPSENDRVLYFFNPFMGELLDNCLKNIVNNRVKDKPKFLIYANPVEDETFGKYFRKVSENLLKPGNVRVNIYTDN